jgi:hypothetical protein
MLTSWELVKLSDVAEVYGKSLGYGPRQSRYGELMTLDVGPETSTAPRWWICMTSLLSAQGCAGKRR